MKKNKVMLAIAVALAVSMTGCGTKNSDTVESQKETVTKVADDKKSENQKKESEKKTEKSEETELKKEETVVKADEKAAAQTTVAENNTSDNSSSNDKANNSSSSNTTGNSNVNRPTGNSNSNTSSGSAGTGGSSSGGNSNSSASNPAPAPTPAPAQPVHTHTWVHVDATGHWETVTIQAAWDEEVPVYEDKELSICNVCGEDITGNTTAHTKAHALAGEGGGYHSEWVRVQTGADIIHHDAVTEQRYIQDSPEYHVCSGCGATTDCNCTR